MFERLESLEAAFRLAERSGGRLQVMAAAALAEPDPTAPLLVFGLGEGPFNFRTLLRQYPSDHPVTLIRSDPTGQATRELPIAELPAAVGPVTTAAVFVPAITLEEARSSPFGLRGIVHRLRAPGGCPWDREQTPRSLIRYVLEEAYEVADAIEHGSSEDVREELGDLLLQVYLQAEIAEEDGRFDLSEVIRELSEKLIRRHPHVFGSVHLGSAAEVERNWEKLKLAERGAPSSALDKLPLSLPALARAREMQVRMSRAGFDWPDRQGALDKLEEELGELRAAVDAEAMTAELGDVLFMLVKVAGDAGVDADGALRAANERIGRRFRSLERVAAERQTTLRALGIPVLLELWQEAKRVEQDDPR